MSAWDGDTKSGLVRALIGTRTCRPFVNLRQKRGGGGGEKRVVVEREKEWEKVGGRGREAGGKEWGGGGTCGGERNRERYGERGSEGEESEGPRWRKSERGE